MTCSCDVFLDFQAKQFQFSFLLSCSECGRSSRRLHLLPELPAVRLPVASLWPAVTRPESLRLPHLQCGYGHGSPADRHVWGQRSGVRLNPTLLFLYSRVLSWRSRPVSPQGRASSGITCLSRWRWTMTSLWLKCWDCCSWTLCCTLWLPGTWKPCFRENMESLVPGTSSSWYVLSTCTSTVGVFLVKLSCTEDQGSNWQRS